MHETVRRIRKAVRAGISEGRRVRGDQGTFEVTDAKGNVIFDHILLDPVWLPLSEPWGPPPK